MTRDPATRTAVGATALAAALVLLPTGAAADGHGFTNHREAPNNGCGLDTPVADFDDRDHAAEVHRRSIDCVAEVGIAEGRDGRYHPSEPVTRGQMASFIAQTLEAAGDRELPEDPDGRFEDTEGSAHEHRIDQLAEIGLVHGRSDDRYEPAGHVTREQMATFVVRAAAWNHTGDVDAYAPAGEDAYFLDIEGSAHTDSIRAGYELWLFEGRAPGEYGPALEVRREQMATFLTRALDLVHPDIYRTDNQTYQLSPTEPVSAPSGEPVEVTVFGSRAEYTNGDEPMPGPVRQALHVALFPCGNVTTDELPATFAGDAVADDIARTDQGHAYISEVNGEPVEGRANMVRNQPPEDGRLDVTVVSPTGQPDCAVVVAFDDRGPADELRLDAGQRPANAFGFAVVGWE